MPDMLRQILRERSRAVARARRQVPLRTLLLEASRRTPCSLVDRLRLTPPPRIIAEIKRASPSAGPLRTELTPATLAEDYAAAGAVAISVLTEPLHFGGSETDLRAVRAAVTLPILRKDFILDSYQLAETAAWGADAVLLIAAALSPQRCRALYAEARALGLETIVEVHCEEELATALACAEAVIGVNRRDLRTLTVDANVTRQLAYRLPSERLRIAASGVTTAAEVAELHALGYHAVLVGETLLRSPQPGRALRALRAATS